MSFFLPYVVLVTSQPVQIRTLCITFPGKETNKTINSSFTTISTFQSARTVTARLDKVHILQWTINKNTFNVIKLMLPQYCNSCYASAVGVGISYLRVKVYIGMCEEASFITKHFISAGAVMLNLFNMKVLYNRVCVQCTVGGNVSSLFLFFFFLFFFIGTFAFQFLSSHFRTDFLLSIR